MRSSLIIIISLIYQTLTTENSDEINDSNIIEYDLSERGYVYIELFPSNIYKFYVAADFGKSIALQFYVYDISYYNSSQSLTIYEYPSKNSSNYLIKSNFILPMTDKSSDTFYFTGTYDIVNSSTKYFVFEIQPYYEIPKAKIYGAIKTYHEYNLTNEKELFLRNLYLEHRYKFFIRVEYEQTVEMHFTRSNSYNKNYEFLTLYKYEKRQSSPSSSAEYRDCNYYDNYNCEAFYTGISKSTNYISFEIYPSYDMISVTVKAMTYFEYSINNNKPQYLSTLHRLLTYKFYFTDEDHYIANVEFNKTDLETESHDIDIYEYNRTYFYRTHFINNTTDSLRHVLFKNIYRVCYEVNSNSTVDIGILLKPKHNIVLSTITITFREKVDKKYYLIDNEELYIEKLYNNNNYRFLIQAKYGQTVNIELNKKDLSNYSYSNIKVYEFPDNSTNTFLWESETFFIYNQNNNSYTGNYRIYYPYTTYFAFDFKPEDDMSDIYLKLKINSPEIKEYNLTSNISLNLGNLYFSNIYKFKVSAKYEYTVNIELTNNDINYASYQYISLYEYSSKDSSLFLYNTFFSLNYSSYNKTYSGKYKVHNSSTDYIIFEMIPYFEMTSAKIKAIAKDKYNYYDLKSGISQYIGSLEFDNYEWNIFYIYATVGDKINIEFNFDYNYDIYDYYIKVYEYSSRYSQNILFIEYIKLTLDSSRTKLSGSYNIIKPSTTYFAFQTIQYMRVESLSVKATVKINGNAVVYDLSEDEKKYIGDLSPSKIYKFYKSTKFGENLNIEISKKDSYSSSSQYMAIHEYSDRYSNNILKESIINLNYSSSENSYQGSYKVDSQSANYLAFIFQPDHEILSAYIEITTGNSNSSLSAGEIILIIFSIIIILAIIGVLLHWYIKKKKNNTSLYIEQNNQSNLAPIISNN